MSVTGMGKLVGLEPFCEWLVASGRAATIAEPAALGLPTGAFARDQHLIALEGSPVAFVSLRMQGAMGPRTMMSTGSFHASGGGLPLAGRQALPIQAHWCARHPDPAGREAKLELQTKGWFKREKVGQRWKGPLAERLNADAELMGWLDGLGPDDKLWLEADKGAGLLRLVHQRPMVFAYGLATPKLLELMRTQLPERFPEAAERVLTLAVR